MVKQERGFGVEAVKMLQQHRERAHDRGHCSLQGNDANEPWQFLDTLRTARAWAKHVERCCTNVLRLQVVEPNMDDHETKGILSRVERKV